MAKDNHSFKVTYLQKDPDKVEKKEDYHIDENRQLSLFEQFEQNEILDRIDKLKNLQKCKKLKK